MKYHKKFYIIAYDISDNKRRNQLFKILERFGQRINYSVFECLMTSFQLCQLMSVLNEIVNTKTDQVAIYELCPKCYFNRKYFPALENQNMDIIENV